MTSRRLLIVEDNAELRHLIRLTLECLDYVIHEAVDGDEAVRRIPVLKPDVVLLDVMMRGALDGLQVCRWIRTADKHKSTRVILLSARAQSDDIKAGMDAGADDYLSKPFSPLDLLTRLQRLESGDGTSAD